MTTGFFPVGDRDGREFPGLPFLGLQGFLLFRVDSFLSGT